MIPSAFTPTSTSTESARIATILPSTDSHLLKTRGAKPVSARSCPIFDPDVSGEKTRSRIFETGFSVEKTRPRILDCPEGAVSAFLVIKFKLLSKSFYDYMPRKQCDAYTASHYIAQAKQTRDVVRGYIA
jgi:hypothetical protein